MALHIISGKHRGRRVETVQDKSMRPTKGNVREAVFNILMHGQFTGFLENARVADLFCGSGALGLEALSRGASHVTFVDMNPQHLQMTRENVHRFGEEANCHFVRSDSVAPPTVSKPYDVIFADPPYRSGVAEKMLTNLAKGKWLVEGSIVVLELARKEDFTVPEEFTALTERVYGVTQIIIVRYR